MRERSDPVKVKHDLWVAIVDALRLEKAVRWVDRQLRKLGGTTRKDNGGNE